MKQEEAEGKHDNPNAAAGSARALEANYAGLQWLERVTRPQRDAPLRPAPAPAPAPNIGTQLLPLKLHIS